MPTKLDTSLPSGVYILSIKPTQLQYNMSGGSSPFDLITL